MKISLSAAQERNLLDALNECIGFRQVEEEEGELYVALMRYAAGHSKRVELDDFIEIEYFSMYDALREMLDTVLEHGVDACAYAFESVSDDYREFIIDVNEVLRQSGDPSDTLLLTLTKGSSGSSYKVNEREVSKDISSRLNNLKIDCTELFTLDIQTPERLGIGGSYNTKTNEIEIFRGAALLGVDSRYYGGKLSPKEAVSVSKDAYMSLVAHSFLHELAHLCERCIPELSIRDDSVSQAVHQIVSAWATHMSQATGMPEPFFVAMLEGAVPDPSNFTDPVKSTVVEIHEIGHSIYSHCSRFKLTLLHLSSIDTKTMFVRPTFVPQIKKKILDGQLLMKSVSGDFMARMEKTPEDAKKQAYDWEDTILEEYKDALDSGGLIFRPKSEIATTDDLLATLKRKKAKLYHNPHLHVEDFVYSSEIPEDLFYTVEGNANLLTMAYDGDAFEQIALVLEHMALTPSRSIAIDIGDPFLGMTIEEGIVQYVYSDYGEVFTKVTLEEAWWLLTL